MVFKGSIPCFKDLSGRSILVQLPHALRCRGFISYGIGV